MTPPESSVMVSRTVPVPVWSIALEMAKATTGRKTQIRRKLGIALLNDWFLFNVGCEQVVRISSLLTGISAAAQVPTAHDVAGGGGGGCQQGFDPCKQGDCGNAPGVRALGRGN